MVPGESSCLGSWGAGGFQSRITGGRSWSLFQKKSPTLRYCKKRISQNLRNRVRPLKSLLPIDYGKQWFAWWGSILKILGDAFFATPRTFSNGPHFIALARLQPTKSWSKLQPLFDKKVFGPLCISITWLFMAHPNISLPFRVTGWRVRDFRFHWFPCSSAKNKIAGLCAFNFDATVYKLLDSF